MSIKGKLIPKALFTFCFFIKMIKGNQISFVFSDFALNKSKNDNNNNKNKNIRENIFNVLVRTRWNVIRKKNLFVFFFV